MTYNNIDCCSTVGIQSDHEMMLSLQRGLRTALRKNKGSAEKRAILSEMLRVCEMYQEIRHAQK
jgi:hypothetical protein